MKKLRIANIAVAAAALVLEALPWGAVLHFAVAPESGGGTDRQTFCYFSLTPFGYANAGPLLTALLTCLIAAAALTACVAAKKEIWRRIIKTLSVAAVVTSLMPLLFGLRYYSLIGLFITLLLAASAVLSGVKTQTPKEQ